MSKGSTQRPTDLDAYRSNYDAIFGKKTPTYLKNKVEEVKVEKPKKPRAKKAKE